MEYNLEVIESIKRMLNEVNAIIEKHGFEEWGYSEELEVSVEGFFNLRHLLESEIKKYCKKIVEE